MSLPLLSSCRFLPLRVTFGSVPSPHYRFASERHEEWREGAEVMRRERNRLTGCSQVISVSCHSFLVPFPFRSLRSVTLHLLPSRRNEVTSDVRDGEEVEGVRNGPGRDQPSHVPSAAEDHPDHEVGSDMSFISFPFPSEPPSEGREEWAASDEMEWKGKWWKTWSEPKWVTNGGSGHRNEDYLMSAASLFLASFRLSPLLTVVSWAEGEAREARTKREMTRDETRNTGDDQGSVCKVGTQDPENLDEELKPLVTVWSRLYPSSVTRVPSFILHSIHLSSSPHVCRSLVTPSAPRGTRRGRMTMARRRAGKDGVGR